MTPFDVCSACDKGGTGLSGMACRVDYNSTIEDGIIEVIDTPKHRAMVYLVGPKRAVEINVWDFTEVNGKVKR